MAILITPTTKILIQGITGEFGARHTRLSLDYGTQVVAGVTPGKAGEDVEGIPVFDSVADAVDKAGANTSNRPRSVMTVIYMDAAMQLAPALNSAQVNDHEQWCPGAVPGTVIDTHKNPVIWPLT